MLEWLDDFQNYDEIVDSLLEHQWWYLSKRRPLHPQVLLFDSVRFSSCSKHNSLLMTAKCSMYLPIDPHHTSIPPVSAYLFN